MVNINLNGLRIIQSGKTLKEREWHRKDSYPDSIRCHGYESIYADGNFLGF